MIYVPGIVLSTLCVLSTYSSPQAYKVGTTRFIPILQMKKLLREVQGSAQSPDVKPGRAGISPKVA